MSQRVEFRTIRFAPIRLFRIFILQLRRGDFLQHGVIPGSSQTKAQGISSPGAYEAILMWPRHDGELRWSIMLDWTCR